SIPHYVLRYAHRPLIDIRIRIEEGQRNRIRKLTIAERDAAGKEVEPLGGRAKLRGRITLGDGEVFARDVIVRDLSTIRTLYRDAGYANVDTNPEMTLDPAKAIVDIDIPIIRNAL